MQVGIITIDGMQVGTVTMSYGDADDKFVPDLGGYEPLGRADAHDEPPATSRDHDGGSRHYPHPHDGGPRQQHPQPRHVETPEEHKHDSIRYGHHHAPSPLKPSPSEHKPEVHQPSGKVYDAERGRPVHQGSAETDQAIRDAARAHGLDVNTMRSIASIESSMNPSSNANRRTQYKGLYQIGRDEWRRFGGDGNIYSARDNAMAAARMFEANRNQFRQRFNRDPIRH
jgi:Transglycosylase SLT domain